MLPVRPGEPCSFCRTPPRPGSIEACPQPSACRPASRSPPRAPAGGRSPQAVVAASHTLGERFGGEVPSTMEELLMLEGVGRKTANVILGGYYGVPGVVVDTHVRRLSQRLGLTGHDDPEKIEQDLMRFIPREEWSAFSLRLIFFGREICTARTPRAPVCPLTRLCPSAKYRGAPPWMARRPPARGPRARTGPTRPRRRGRRAGQAGGAGGV